MIPLTERRRIVAEKLFELANIGAGVIVFGELVGRGEIRSVLVVFGILFFSLLYAVGFVLLSK